MHWATELFEEMHQKSVRRLLGNLTKKTSGSSIYRMLRYDLNWTLYTFVFFEEAIFYLNAQVNKGLTHVCWVQKPNVIN